MRTTFSIIMLATAAVAVIGCGQKSLDAASLVGDWQCKTFDSDGNERLSAKNNFKLNADGKIKWGESAVGEWSFRGGELIWSFKIIYFVSKSPAETHYMVLKLQNSGWNEEAQLLAANGAAWLPAGKVNGATRSAKIAMNAKGDIVLSDYKEVTKDGELVPEEKTVFGKHKLVCARG